MLVGRKVEVGSTKRTYDINLHVTHCVSHQSVEIWATKKFSLSVTLYLRLEHAPSRPKNEERAKKQLLMPSIAGTVQRFIKGAFWA